MIQATARAGVVPNSAPCQIMHPLVLVGLGVGVGEGLGLGVGLGLGNQVVISTRGCIIWQRCRILHNTGTFVSVFEERALRAQYLFRARLTRAWRGGDVRACLKRLPFDVVIKTFCI